LVETVIRNVYNKEDIVFSELDRKFITAFERYLKETRGLARNTAAKYLECFRKVLKVAQQKGWMEHGKFLEELGELCVKEETYPSFLDWDELRTVMETDMPAGRLERVKDVFVFCALTGLSYQGISTLCPSHLFRDDEGTLWICRTRAEGAEVGDSCTSRVPLLKPAMVLLEKYRGWNPMNPEGPCFPVPSVQKMNEYLKEVAVRCRISKRLTTQMARNTFAATVTLANRIPKEHVREMLGYSSDYMLRHYMQAQERNP
jgi:integrase